MLTVSDRIECQQPEGAEPAGADLAQVGCESVVLVQCLEAQQQAAPTEPADLRQMTRQKLDARRLRQLQAQVGLNAVEVTGERPSAADSDLWEGFRQSVASAGVPGCFSSNPPSQQSLAAQGLLALPFLLHAAATGKCR